MKTHECGICLSDLMHHQYEFACAKCHSICNLNPNTMNSSLPQTCDTNNPIANENRIEKKNQKYLHYILKYFHLNSTQWQFVKSNSFINEIVIMWWVLNRILWQFIEPNRCRIGMNDFRAIDSLQQFLY